MAAHNADADVIAVAILARRFAISAAILAHRLLRALNLSHCMIALMPKRHDFLII
jgi:hypothetical protein